MKRVLLLTLTLLTAFALAACGSPSEQPAAAQAPNEATAAEPAATEVPVEKPAETAPPEATAEPSTPYFIVSYEDGTPVPDKIEGRVGEDNVIRLFFAIENGEGMVGWDRDALYAAGITSDMSFQFIDEKGLMVTAWAEKATECACKFFINGSDDWANPDVLYEKEFQFVFTA